MLSETPFTRLWRAARRQAGRWTPLACCLAWTTIVRAEDAPVAVDGKGWALPYALVILCIVLGMLPLCRPSRREDPQRMKYQ